jgi:hypothetical protein
MKRNTKFSVAITSILISVHISSAQMLIPVNPNVANEPLRYASGGFGSFKSDYEYRGDDFYIKRTMLFGTFSQKISDLVELVGFGGITTKAEFEEYAASGDGHFFGGGFRLTPWSEDGDSFVIGAQLMFIDEDYGTERFGSEFVDLSGKGREVALSAMYHRQLEGAKLYGGLQVVPYSDLDIKIREYGVFRRRAYDFTEKFNVERDDLFSIHVGGSVDVGKVELKLDVFFVGETTLLLSLGKAF